MELCVGCLSSDRSLKPIVHEDVRTLMFILLEPPNSFDISAQLCWECYAVIRKIQSFRNQVNVAASQLAQCLLQPLVSLSKLTIVHEPTRKSKSEIQSEDHQSVKDESNDIKIESEEIDTANDVYTESDDEPLRYSDVKAERLPIVVDDIVESSENLLKSRRRHKKKDVTDTSSTGPGTVSKPRRCRKLEELHVTHDLIEKVVLSTEEIEAERLRIVSSEAFFRLQHKCLPCGVGFNHRAKKDNHMKKHEEAAGSCVCALCSVRCKDARALDAHQRRHTHRWRCKLCLALWSRPSVAADHAARAHAAPAPRHRCRQCSHRAESLAQLRAHAREHAASVACPTCGKSFSQRESLRTHMFIHRGEKEYSCPVCGKMFLFKKSMELHAITHQASAELYCHTCDKTFKNQMSYYSHMRYNLKHIDPALLKHVCAECGRRFASAARLADHARAVHTHDRPLRCPRDDCRFRASSRSALRSHARSHAPRPRNHVCHRCGNTYTSGRALERHVRAENGQRPPPRRTTAAKQLQENTQTTEPVAIR